MIKTTSPLRPLRLRRQCRQCILTAKSQAPTAAQSGATFFKRSPLDCATDQIAFART